MRDSWRAQNDPPRTEWGVQGYMRRTLAKLCLGRCTNHRTRHCKVDTVNAEEMGASCPPPHPTSKYEMGPSSDIGNSDVIFFRDYFRGSSADCSPQFGTCLGTFPGALGTHSGAPAAAEAYVIHLVRNPYQIGNHRSLQADWEWGAVWGEGWVGFPPGE